MDCCHKVKRLSFCIHALCVFLLAVICAPSVAQSGVFLTEDDFYQQTFNSQVPDVEVLWLKAEQKEQAKNILGRPFSRLRVRYRSLNQRSAWILEEIGKDRPITFGVVVDKGRIADISVLEYRESRGGEIRHNFFTDQFLGLGLRNNQAPTLDGRIDGITGATLSVRASRKIATLALFFHQLVMDAKPSELKQARR